MVGALHECVETYITCINIISYDITSIILYHDKVYSGPSTSTSAGTTSWLLLLNLIALPFINVTEKLLHEWPFWNISKIG